MERKMMEIYLLRYMDNVWKHWPNFGLIDEINQPWQERYDEWFIFVIMHNRKKYDFEEFNILTIKYIIELLESRNIYVSWNPITKKYFNNPIRKIFKWKL